MVAREDSQDLYDASLLIRHLGIKSVDGLLLLIDAYKDRYHPKTLQVSREFAKAAMRQANQFVDTN